MTAGRQTKHCVIAGLHITLHTEDQELLRLLAPRYAVFEHPEAAADQVALSLTDCSDHTLGPRLEGATLTTEFDCQGAWCQFYETAEEIEITMTRKSVMVNGQQTAGNESNAALTEQPLIAHLRCNTTFSQARCWLSGPAPRREYCFNNFMMMLFAFVALQHQTLLFHASVIGHAGRGYLFLAESGTGKSTHSALWLKHIPGSQLLNDDNPAVGLRDGQMIVYGTPWSGKTPCYRDCAMPVGAMVDIRRDTTNHIEPQNPVQAFASHMSSCSGIRWNRTLYRAQCDTLAALVERVHSYTMYCRPDREAAVVCSMGVGAWDGLDGDFTINDGSMRPNAVNV